MTEISNIDYLQILKSTWNFVLFNAEGNPITIGSLITGSLLLSLAYWGAKRLTKQIQRRLIDRLDIESSLKYALGKVTFYLLLVIFTLFVMHLLNIPVTIFTVLGGALAIGVGFGSQNIMNNFISGLILMIERPVRVGDFVEVNGMSGNVEHIGARSTSMRSARNTQLIVPNSAFLENSVLNYTLDDDIVRGIVSVGVAYGSDVKRVKKLIEQSIEEQSVVLRGDKFPIEIHFDNFGESSLDFTGYFFVRAGNLFDVKKIESDVRYSIYEKFNEAGVSIPFPQRDLHIYNHRPIQSEFTGRV